MKLKRLTEMNLTELATWYEETVGYNPYEEDPTLTREQLLKDCQEYCAEADLCPVYGN